MNGFFGCLGMVLILLYGAAQFIAAFAGIQYELGTGWAIGAVVLTLFSRSTLFIVIGAFFGAWHVWGWHWFWALLFAMPTLAFVIPGAIVSAFQGLRH